VVSLQENEMEYLIPHKYNQEYIKCARTRRNGIILDNLTCEIFTLKLICKHRYIFAANKMLCECIVFEKYPQHQEM